MVSRNSHSFTEGDEVPHSVKPGPSTLILTRFSGLFTQFWSPVSFHTESLSTFALYELAAARGLLSKLPWTSTIREQHFLKVVRLSMIFITCTPPLTWSTRLDTSCPLNVVWNHIHVARLWRPGPYNTISSQWMTEGRRIGSSDKLKLHRLVQTNPKRLYPRCWAYRHEAHRILSQSLMPSDVKVLIIHLTLNPVKTIRQILFILWKRPIFKSLCHRYQK